MLCDWDDARIDYLVYDLAVFIGNMFIKPQKLYTQTIKSFLQGYQTITSLNEEEKKAMYYFIQNSLLWGLEYGAKQKQIHTEKEKGITSWMVNHEKKYLRIKKIGIYNFLKCFK